MHGRTCVHGRYAPASKGWLFSGFSYLVEHFFSWIVLCLQYMYVSRLSGLPCNCMTGGRILVKLFTLKHASVSCRVESELCYFGRFLSQAQTRGRNASKILSLDVFQRYRLILIGSVVSTNLEQQSNTGCGCINI